MTINHFTIKIIAIAFIIIICIINSAMARPKENHHRILRQTQWEGCDEKLEEVCQQCAKATKSPIVYPLCCKQKEGATTWCKAYLRYGIHV